MWFIIVVILSIVPISLATAAEKRIGLLTFSDQPRYLEAKRGIMDSLKESGYEEPQTEFIVETADANKAVAATFVKKFAAAKMDLILTIGTHATLSIAGEIKDVPIVFTQVYDPVAAGIAKDWHSSGNNTRGTSTKVRMCKLVEALKQLAPVKILGVLYKPGEKNSEIQLRNLEGIQAQCGIQVVPVALTKPEEIEQLLPVVLHRTDALYITGSNFVDSQIAAIVDMATKAKVITISHLEDLIEKGVLLGVGPNSYLIGHIAGEKAVSILKGGAQPSSLPIETLKQFDVMLNLKTAKAAGFHIPEDLMKKANKIIQ